MDAQRGRSPSAGRNHIRNSPSPSPHGPFTSQATALGSDPILSDPFANQSHPGQSTFNIDQSYLLQSTQQQFSAAPDVSSHTFLQANSYQAPGNPSSSDILDSNADFSGFQNQFYNTGAQSQSQDIDPSLFLDSSLLDQSQGDGLAPDANNLYNMSTVHQSSPDPPHMLQQNPNAQHGGLAPHRTSLDPSSAAYPQGQNSEWAGMASYQGHRRAHSDALSDVSSSAQVSPFLGNTDSYDALDQNSPLLNPTHDPTLYNDALGLGSFTLNDSQAHISPGHSPRLSPHLSAQQQFSPGDSFGMLSSNGQFSGQIQQDMYQQGYQGQETFPQVANYDPRELNHGEHFSPPPEISIDFAPPARQPSFKPNTQDGSTLEPPGRSRGRERRATSDPQLVTPGSSRGNSPSRAGPPSLHPSDSLSPRQHTRSLSRPGTPSGITKNHHSRRASVGAIPQDRAYLVDFATAQTQNQDLITPSASPGSNTSNVGDGPSSSTKRAKHPANFQCHLCSKRFTRAYNLRSHLRTHTDERPFVCTQCGKAFARQHDRKRHEGLHSGEKKFVCQGHLAGGTGQWGCGRRFARADALGRHFKSEAGRGCIKPLLDEEARERQLALQEQVLQDQLNAGQSGGMAQPPPMMAAPGQVDFSGMPLPAALLQQYPVLATMWDSLQQTGPGTGNDIDEGDYSARSSFEASSGGEGYFDEDDQGYTIDDNWSTVAETSQRAAYSDYDG